MAIGRFLSLSAVMLVATMIMGALPLIGSLSPWRVSAFAAFGSGLLIGAALSVVLPEGIGSVYGAAEGDQSHVVGYSVTLGFSFMFILDSIISWTEDSGAHHGEAESTTRDVNGSYFLADDEEDERPGRDIERSISPATPTPLLKRHIRREKPAPQSNPKKQTLSTVVGLLVHSLADGLSLGASSAFALTGDTHLDLVVFAAILVHKAPAAFGLSSILLQAKAPRPYVRRIVVLFASAAPVGGLFTFAGIKLFATDNRHLEYLTGVALLISAGTFLFVSTHVLVEAEETPPTSSESLGKRGRTAFVLAGLILPGAMSALIGGHSH